MSTSCKPTKTGYPTEQIKAQKQCDNVQYPEEPTKQNSGPKAISWVWVPETILQGVVYQLANFSRHSGTGCMSTLAVVTTQPLCSAAVKIKQTFHWSRCPRWCVWVFRVSKHTKVVQKPPQSNASPVLHLNLFKQGSISHNSCHTFNARFVWKTVINWLR